ncbi:PREDICTED: uncharacterized protein LOC109150497 isoform X2 [Ipomoea nil]|uniref:uncharacterized protein LOC109150497 isoform X2 n=1 Tax=Ipomoea nil TaxID=35883 RepID=UPI000900C849|nr:PREDICTED: uncharacterized protein LOC109150497 isoform X2 [Ipomoea nil]
MAMGQEEHPQKCSNSSSDGGGEGVCSSRSSKKMKPKKIPQRGLGVAQLEKIRLEEQHRRDNPFQAVSLLSPNSMVSSLQIPQSHSILLPNISRPHLSSSPSSTPLPPPPPPPDITSPSFRASPTSKVDQPLHSNPAVQFSKQLNLGGGDRGRLMIPGNSYWPKLWNGEYNLEGENHHGITFRPNINLPIESHTSVLPLPRSQQYQQPASSSMVNNLSEISSSSVRNFQIEPPSNQNYRGNDYAPLWPEEVKMVGVKRPYPFSPEYPPLPSFNYKFPHGYVPSTSRPNEPTSCTNGSIVINVESRNLPIREDTSNSNNAQFDSNSRSFNQENGGLNGDFLSLAPPSAALQIDPRYHHYSRNPLPLNQEASSQRGGEEFMKRSGINESAEPQIFSFFPAAKVQTTDVEESPKRRYNSDSNGVVDLNLKL